MEEGRIILKVDEYNDLVRSATKYEVLTTALFAGSKKDKYYGGLEFQERKISGILEALEPCWFERTVRKLEEEEKNK